MNDLIVCGDELGGELAKKLKVQHIPVITRIFPDGEVQPRLEREARAKKAILLLRKRADENINSYIIRYYLLAKKLRSLANEVIGVMPYLPYARQDTIFRDGEPLSSGYIAELIEKCVDTFITINMHEHRKRIHELFSIPSFNLSAFPLLAREFTDFDKNNSLVIAPDEEAEKYVSEFIQVFESDHIVMKKTRDVRTGKIKLRLDEKSKLKNRDVIIVDDIVSSGGTIVKVAEECLRSGAKSVSMAFVHGLLVENAIKKLMLINPKKIVSTNTVENRFERVNVVPLISKFVKKRLK